MITFLVIMSINAGIVQLKQIEMENYKSCSAAIKYAYEESAARRWKHDKVLAIYCTQRLSKDVKI